jgi:hypothetical protein
MKNQLKFRVFSFISILSILFSALGMPSQNALAAQITDATPPAAPVDLTAVAGDAQADLTWTANVETDLAGYNVYRSETSPVMLTDPINGSTLVVLPDYADVGLVNDVEYFYVVTAVNASGIESLSSTEVSAVPTSATSPPIPLDDTNELAEAIPDPVLPSDVGALDAAAGTALQFNGSNQYVTFGSATGMTTGLGVQVFTIETWFKRTGTGVATSTGTGGLATAIPLVTKGRGENENSTVDMNYFFGIDNATSHLAADFEECSTANSPAGCPAGGTAGLNHPVYGSTAIQNNVWYHAAVTYDGRYWKLYLNGALETMTGSDVGATRYPRWDSIQHAGIGTAMTSTGATAGFFNGIIDETRIWNVVRTQSDIQASIYSELTTGTGLIGRWGLNEGSGTAAVNSIAGRPNGTLMNTPTWVSGFPLPDTTPPAAPTMLTATPFSGSVGLSWTAPADLDVAGYNVYRSTVSPVSLTDPVNGGTLVTAASYLDAGLTNGTPYYYMVTAVDTSSNESVASNEATATPLASLGSGLNFDGTNDYVTFGPNLNATSFTLEAWVKRAAGGATMTTGSLGLDGSSGRPLAYPVLTKGMGQGESPANINMNYFLGITNTGVVGADFEDNAGGVNHPAWGSSTLAIGEWHHIAATYNGSCWSLYLDGSLETLNAAVTACPSATPEFTSIQHAGLAAGIGSTGQLSTGFFSGAIDEARVWNVARTEAEIMGTINDEVTSGSGLIGRWGMNEGSGTTIASSIGTIPGTLTNGTAWTAGAPFNIAPPTPPAAPTLLAATPTAGLQIDLSWTDNSDSETSFKVERSPDGSAGWTQIGTTAANIAAYSNTGLDPATQYCYRVRASNSIGDSDYSNISCATTPGDPNNGLNFGSSAAYVGFGDPAALDLAQFTIETWFKRIGAGTSNTTGNGGIVNAIPLVTHGAPEAEGSSVEANWVLVIDDATDVIAADFEDMATGLNHPVLGTTPITNNVWHHAAATYDGSTWRLYLDGNLEATLSVNAAPRSDSTQLAGLGAMFTTTGTALGHFDGMLDEVRVWDYARSQAEIQGTMNSPITSPQTALVARWGLDETAGTTVSSSAGTLVNGTITGTGYSWGAGSPSIVNHAPAFVSGSPNDGATGVSTSPTLTVNVSDADLDNQTISFYGRPKNIIGDDFTMIVIPDPQYYAATYPSIYNAQMQWVVDNKNTRNIPYVISLGDNVDDSLNTTQWTRATTAWDMLTTAGVPYGIEAGNHDGAPTSTANFNTNFGSRKTSQTSTYGGRYETSDYDNYYTFFDAGGMHFIVVFIEYDGAMTSTTNPVLVWANNLLSTHSDRRAIVVTHNLLNGGTSTSFSGQGQAIYDALKGNPNLFLMLGGHLDIARHRTDTFNGNTVYSLRSDYQMVDSQQSGYLRMMRFSPTNNLIYVSTYSPTQLKDYPLEISENNFTLPYTMAGSADFTLIGTDDAVLAGTDANITWTGLSSNTDYEWYAVSSDGSLIATSATRTFTTENLVATCYALTLNSGANGSAPMANPLKSAACATNGQYVEGEAIQLTAAPNAGYQVASWTGTNNDASTSITNSLTMPASDRTVGVNYVQSEYTLTITILGSGTVTPDNAGPYHYNDPVNLTATPLTDWAFAGWSGDASGSANPLGVTMDGSKSITAIFVPIGGSALDFGGTNAYVDFLNPAKLHLSPFTIETWFRRDGPGDTTQTGSGGSFATTLVARGRGEIEDPTVDLNYFLGIDGASNKLVADFEEGATGTNPSQNHPVYGTTTITTGGWHHVAATYDGTTWMLYLDGALDGQLAVGEPVAAAGNQYASIGSALLSTGVADGFFDGLIDETRIWNRALSESEIQANINQEVTTGSGLVARWGLNEGTGTSIYDSLSTPADGTLLGANYTWTSGAPFNIPIAPTISGNAGVAGAMLSYTDGTEKIATADDAGLYSFEVSYNWSGTVTPSKPGYTFTPLSKIYTNVTANKAGEDYIAAQVTHTIADFNGDGATDIGVFRPSTGAWYIEGMPYAELGTAEDILVPGDYDGDGTTEIAVFRPSTGYWYIQGQPEVGWGMVGDIPVPGDYDGDGVTEVGVFRPSEGAWYIEGQPLTIWGGAGDIAVPADYDGDGKTDIAVYQAGVNSLWWIKGQPSFIMWGTAGDVLVPADYNGDGKTEVAVYREGVNSLWWVMGEPSFTMWGTTGNTPVPGDYNGDGKTEVAVYQEGVNSLWWVVGEPSFTMWGTIGDIPLTKKP